MEIPLVPQRRSVTPRVGRPSRRRTSVSRYVHAREHSWPSSFRSKLACRRRRFGIVSTTYRCATGAQTSSATWIDVSKTRF